jgi:hypothetical protein
MVQVANFMLQQVKVHLKPTGNKILGKMKKYKNYKGTKHDVGFPLQTHMKLQCLEVGSVMKEKLNVTKDTEKL